jgi:MFS transporter, DHA1 family, quinolone resistance protein
MKERLSIIFGVFAVMALSNAVVPVLPFFAKEFPAVQGAIFSAYFFGAFLTVYPAGLLSDRIGKILLIRVGLILTIVSGAGIVFFQGAYEVILLRFIEGIGAGMFISAALSWVNEQEDHKLLTGYFFACLNLGLVLGLVATGVLDETFGERGGMILFTFVSVIPLLLNISAKETVPVVRAEAETLRIISDYRWLYLSTIILVGSTGVLTSLYPEFTDESPFILSIMIGIMNVSTIISSFAASRTSFRPIPVIRAGALLMAVSVVSAYFAPAAGIIPVVFVFTLAGLIAGFILVGQTDFLAGTGYRQGVIVGLFNMASYGGMTFLPYISGVLSQYVNYFTGFVFTALLSLVVVFTIGRCGCKNRE